jgi:hypothetical protein
MATDGTDEAEESMVKKGGRGHHSPVHASEKHERQEKKSVAEDALEDKTPEDTEDVPADAAAGVGDEAEVEADAAAAVGEAAAKNSPTPGQKPHRRLLGWLKSHKKISIPLGVVVLVAVLFAVPPTRYLLAGTVLQQSFSVTVLDEQTKKPVTGATVALSGKTALTNNKGVAVIKTNVGNASLTVTKKYYTSSKKDVLVPIGKQKNTEDVNLKATGRQVPVVVTNSISGKPVANVSVKVLGTVSKTDPKGEAIVVLPADKVSVEATLSGNALNDKKVSVKVTAAVDPANKFTVTPAGKIYFLSDLTGSLDLVKANLDGTERQTILPGTGKEDKPNTILLASRDWKYIALHSKRDGGDYGKLFLVDAESGQTTIMDEGDGALFGPVGWSGHRFIYTVYRNKMSGWQPKRAAVKSYDAETKKITILDETSADGPDYNYAYENIANTYILDKEIFIAKNWYGNGYNPPLGGKQHTLVSVQADGTQKRTIKGYPTRPVYSYVDTRPGDLNEIYVRYSDGGTGKATFEAYEDGKIAPDEYDDNRFYSSEYTTYLVSPTGKHTFWTESRDGKNVFFVGDSEGKNGKLLPGAGSEDYRAYGWFTDEYLLVTKKNSEMHILPVGGLQGGVETSPKISDYYKPVYNNRGYGYGYGG